tara:strand:+ start:63 stop:305 length:243 start_codon:yes stop_codon:yes gene_type:complete
MQEKIKTICLILITVFFIVFIVMHGFSVWHEWQKDTRLPLEYCANKCTQQYPSADKKDQIKLCLKACLSKEVGADIGVID